MDQSILFPLLPSPKLGVDWMVHVIKKTWSDDCNIKNYWECCWPGKGNYKKKGMVGNGDEGG